MSAEIEVNGDEPDAHLIADLQSFGLTLQAETEAAFVQSVVELLDEPASPGSNASETRRWWLAAAAAVAVAAAVMVAVTVTSSTWLQEQQTVDATNSAADGSGATADTGSGENESGDESQQDESVADGLAETMESLIENAEPVAILAADGTELGLWTPTDPGDGLSADCSEAKGCPGPPWTPSLQMTGAVELEAEGFVDAVVRMMLSTSGDVVDGAETDRLEALLRGGVTAVNTTLDPAVQALAVASIRDVGPDPDGGYVTGLATVDNDTGAILASAGNFQRGDATLSAAITNRAQPGSAMKPIVLAEAFEQGYLPHDLIRADGPCTFLLPEGSTYTVGGAGSSRTSLAKSTQTSNNCAFVRLGQVVGNDRVVTLARRMGMSSIREVAGEFLSVPLGTEEVSPIEVAGAYATFANDGISQPTFFIDSVVFTPEVGDPSTRRPETGGSGEAEQVVSSTTARLMNEVLVGVVTDGTGRRAYLDDQPVVAGKTGTTSNFENAWFVGYSADYTTAVWLGDPVTQRKVVLPDWGTTFGGELPAEIWRDFNSALHANTQTRPLKMPAPYESSEPDQLPELDSEVADN